MKKSELRQFIREEIKNTISEFDKSGKFDYGVDRLYPRSTTAGGRDGADNRKIVQAINKHPLGTELFNNPKEMERMLNVIFFRTGVPKGLSADQIRLKANTPGSRKLLDIEIDGEVIGQFDPSRV